MLTALLHTIRKRSFTGTWAKLKPKERSSLVRVISKFNAVTVQLRLEACVLAILRNCSCSTQQFAKRKVRAGFHNLWCRSFKGGLVSYRTNTFTLLFVHDTKCGHPKVNTSRSSCFPCVPGLCYFVFFRFIFSTHSFLLLFVMYFPPLCRWAVSVLYWREGYSHSVRQVSKFQLSSRCWLGICIAAGKIIMWHTTSLRRIEWL
jgi:hypothetical protein